MGYLSITSFGSVAACTGILASRPHLRIPPVWVLQPMGRQAAKVAMPGPSLTVREALRTRNFWLIWLTWATVGAAPIVAMVTRSVNYQALQGVELQTAVIILTAFNLTNGLSRILTGYFSDRISAQSHHGRGFRIGRGGVLHPSPYLGDRHSSGAGRVWVSHWERCLPSRRLWVADHFGLRHFGPSSAWYSRPTGFWPGRWVHG